VLGFVPLGSEGFKLSLCEAVSHVLNHFLFFSQELIVDEQRNRALWHLGHETGVFDQSFSEHFNLLLSAAG
jgi:hypothetical protein